MIDREQQILGRERFPTETAEPVARSCDAVFFHVSLLYDWCARFNVSSKLLQIYDTSHSSASTP